MTDPHGRHTVVDYPRGMDRLAPRFGLKLGVSLLIAAAIVVPLAVVGVSVARRNIQLDRMASPDLVLREHALNAFIRQAPHDPRWVAGLAQRLEGFPDDAIVPAVNAMRAAGVGDDIGFHDELARTFPGLSDDVFLAVTPLFLEAQPAGRLAVIAESMTRLRSAPDEPARARWVALLDSMHAWNSPAVPIDLYVDWLAQGVDAELPALREHTARRLGDLPINQPGIDATLVAAPLRTLLADGDPQVRTAALRATAGYLPRHAAFLADIQRAASDTDPQVRSTAERLRRVWSQSQLDAASRKPQPFADSTPSRNTNTWHTKLIELDALAPASIEITFDDAMPHHVRVAAVRVGQNADPHWLLDTLRINDRSALRDVALLTLAQRFTAEQLGPFVVELLQDYDPEARLSGAVLSGLTGLGAQSLETASRRERSAVLRRGMLIGLWMQGRRPELNGQVPSLLGSGVVPDSTLLLAMLHGGEQRAALDHLLALGADQSGDTAEVLRRTTALLRSERWSRVLSAYLPPTAPKLPLDAGDPVFAGQLADLRAWHALFRFE